MRKKNCKMLYVLLLQSGMLSFSHQILIHDLWFCALCPFENWVCGNLDQLITLDGWKSSLTCWVVVIFHVYSMKSSPFFGIFWSLVICFSHISFSRIFYCWGMYMGNLGMAKKKKKSKTNTCGLLCFYVFL